MIDKRHHCSNHNVKHLTVGGCDTQPPVWCHQKLVRAEMLTGKRAHSTPIRLNSRQPIQHTYKLSWNRA